jgi:hypothetical protein
VYFWRELLQLATKLALSPEGKTLMSGECSWPTTQCSWLIE